MLVPQDGLVIVTLQRRAADKSVRFLAFNDVSQRFSARSPQSGGRTLRDSITHFSCTLLLSPGKSTLLPSYIFDISHNILSIASPHSVRRAAFFQVERLVALSQLLHEHKYCIWLTKAADQYGIKECVTSPLSSLYIYSKNAVSPILTRHAANFASLPTVRTFSAIPDSTTSITTGNAQ